MVAFPRMETWESVWRLPFFSEEHQKDTKNNFGRCSSLKKTSSNRAAWDSLLASAQLKAVLTAVRLETESPRLLSIAQLPGIDHEGIPLFGWLTLKGGQVALWMVAELSASVLLWGQKGPPFLVG